MKHLSVFLLFTLTVLSNSLQAQTKQITLEHKGGYVARFLVTWKEYGKDRKWESGNGIAVNWSKTLTLNQEATNISLTVEVLNVFTYGSACTKNVGSSSGTFTAEGLLGNVRCDWNSDDLSASSGQITSSEDVNIIQPGGNSNLHLAVTADDRNQAKSLIQNGITHMETKNMKGYTPLHEAVQRKSNEMVQLLLDNGANANETNNQNQTPLFMAVNLGANDIVQTLFSAGVTANSDLAALDRVVTKRDAEMARIFLQNGADANFMMENALKANNAELIELAIFEGGAIPTIEVFKKAVDTRKFPMAESFLDNPMSNIDPNEALDYAVLKNAKNLVPKTLEKGADAQKALSYAVQSKDMNLANDVISMYGANPNTVLDETVRTNQVQLFDVLINNGVDPNAALAKALTYKNGYMVKKSLEAGATASASLVGQTAATGDNETLRILVENGQGNPNDGMSSAIAAGKYQTVEFLVQAGAAANPDQTAKLAGAGQNNILKLLVQAGQADPNDGLSAALAAAQYTTAEMLIQAGASPENVVKTAVEKSQRNLLVAALDAGADAAPGLETAVTMGSSEYTKLLIEKGATDIKDTYMATAAKSKKLELVKILLDAGGNAQAGLAVAVEANSPEIVDLLIKSGANGADDSLVRKSIGFNNVGLTKLLVDAGADANMGIEDAVVKAPAILEYFAGLGLDLGKQQYLDASVNAGNAMTTKILLENGCDVDHVDGAGNTYLHRAANLENVALARVIIEKGVDVNRSNNSGDAPLHVAVRGGRDNHEMVGLLVTMGADVNAKDGSGQRALDFAKGSRVKRALKDAGAN